MAKRAEIEPTRTSVSREGESLVLEMETLADIKFLNNQMVQFGIRNARRVEQYLERLDKVMETTGDERIIVAATSVAVNALKAVVNTLKADVVNFTQNIQQNYAGGQELPELTRDDLRAIRTLAGNGKAQARKGRQAGPKKRADGDSRKGG